MNEAVKPSKEDIAYVHALEYMMRVQCLIERKRRGEPTGEDAAQSIQREAEEGAHRILQLRWHLEGADRDRFAHAMGWPTAAALHEFIEKGAASGKVN